MAVDIVVVGSSIEQRKQLPVLLSAEGAVGATGIIDVVATETVLVFLVH